MSQIIFWGAVVFIVYTYILFPALVFLVGKLRRRPYLTANITPPITIIIAAYNEAKNIGAKLDNFLSLDYPHKMVEVVVASDGSDDETESIVLSYAKNGVRLLALPRKGKASALNNAVAASTGEILVFSDANSIFAQDALRALVRPFADSRVGGVAGNQCYLKKNGGTGITSDGEHTYWNFDRFLKRSQSKAGNVISATGAIYAIRRSLFHNIPGGVTDDFVISTGVILDGFRLVFANDAIAYEPAASSSEAEFGRKVRIITRGLQAVIERRQLLNPFRFGFYSLQLFSHKVMRRLVVFPLLLLLLTSPFLWNSGLFYKTAILGQLIFYGLAIMGLLLKGTRICRNKIFTIPFFFVMVNTACLLAVINILRGHKIDRWEPHRVSSSTPIDSSPRFVSSDGKMQKL